jgi:predicted DNA-binding antitoxin AbrB/MazE fold protein
MSITVEAFYEAGILKPLTPLTALKDKTKVRVTIEPQEKPLPNLRRVEHSVDLSKEREWLLAHRDEYRGQWVVLDGDRLVGHTADRQTLKEIFTQARADGVSAPFVQRVPLDDESIWSGIL